MKRTLQIALLVIGILGGYFFPLIQPVTTHEVVREIVTPAPESVGIALPNSVAVFETSLASPISTSASSMTLTANSVRGGSALSGYQCFTIDEGSANAEFICGTISGTTVSSLTRGVDPLNGTSTVTALKFAHRRGANVKVTDFPLITLMRNQLNGVETFENLLVYSTSSQPCAVGSATGTICAKAYIDAVAVAGASNADDTTKGIVERATLAEASSTTALGGTGAATFIGGNLVGATPFASGIVMAQSSGKILQGWLDLAANWALGGTFSVAGTSTLATTSITSLSVSSTSTFSGGVVGVVDYWTATASSSWIKPNGVSTSSIMVIEVWGAGGAGGGTDSGGGTPYGGGGGGGGYLRYEMLTSTATSTVFCRVGGGGVGAINTAGTAGGNTTFGTFATAYGGGGGGNANGAGNNGSGGGGGGTPAAGGTGAAGTAAFAGGGYGASATLNQDGHAGGFAAAYNGGAGGASVYGGGGGGAPSASGGASVYGGGGGGGGNGSSASASVYAGAGGGANVAGTAPAGGGGGASGQGVAGKGGGNGQCKITTWK